MVATVRNISLHIENFWVRPDGRIHPGSLQALDSPTFLPGWMIRTEGWALVSRSLQSLSVEFDPFCIGTAAFTGMLDVVKSVAGNRPIAEVEVRHHDKDHLVRWQTSSPLSACWYICRVRELAGERDNARYLAMQKQGLEVDTQVLDPADWIRPNTLPHARAFLDAWRNTQELSQLIRCIDGASQYTSVFRLEDGDPRVLRLGGSLPFVAPAPEGARLADVVPGAQERASHARIATAIRFREPVLRRHRSADYDILALSVPAHHGGEIVALSMHQPYPATRAAHAGGSRAATRQVEGHRAPPHPQAMNAS